MSIAGGSRIARSTVRVYRRRRRRLSSSFRPGKGASHVVACASQPRLLNTHSHIFKHNPRCERVRDTDRPTHARGTHRALERGGRDVHIHSGRARNTRVTS